VRVLFLPIGSRGDVQPLLALALMLQSRGHAVSICASENYRSWIEGLGVPYAWGGRDVQKVISGLGERAFNPITFMRAGLDLSRESFDAHLAAASALSPDAIVAGALAFGAPALREMFGAKLFWASFFPGTYRTAEYALPLLGVHFRSRLLHRITWLLGMVIMEIIARPMTNTLRREHGLQPAKSLEDLLYRSGTVLHAVDALVAPIPRDWRLDARETGYWFLDDRTPLPAEIEAFLDAGPPPVYIGFGSMPIKAAARRTRRIVEGVEAAGARALISSGWSGLGADRLPPSCMRIGAVSHAMLFPRVAAVVHHAGAGTTAAALRAGVPQIPVPHGFDQAAWSHHLVELGVSTAPLSPGFSSTELARAIGSCLGDDALRDRALRVGDRIRAGNGVARAAELIEAAA
jgi:UDP:flavonoid glycosyltransferase YjiC (YdhE family)